MPRVASSEPPAVAKYRKIMAEHADGVSLEVLAKRLGVKRKTLTWWKWEVKRRDRAKRQATRARRSAKKAPAKKPQKTQLLPVKVASSADVPSRPALGFEVLLRSDVAVRVPIGFDAVELRRLVATLDSPAC